jgi:hypothetical protein
MNDDKNSPTDKIVGSTDGLGGAVDLGSCQKSLYRWGRWHCDCGKCSVCGHQKHTGIHGPFYGHPPGTKPYGHEYKPPIAALTGEVDSTTGSGAE